MIGVGVENHLYKKVNCNICPKKKELQNIFCNSFRY